MDTPLTIKYATTNPPPQTITAPHSHNIQGPTFVGSQDLYACGIRIPKPPCKYQEPAKATRIQVIKRAIRNLISNHHLIT